MKRSFASVVAQAGSQAHSSGHVTPPIPMSTTFARDASLGLLADTDYSRDGTPIHRAAEQILTALEGGCQTLLFASGMAAADAILALLRPGDHLVFPSAGYWALRKHVERLSAHRGFTLSVVDMTNLDEVREAVRPDRTRLVWIESPANPCWEITDIEAVSSIARAAGALSCVDSTVATPLFTRPLDLGADLVMHSATKYLNGHSDVLAGAVVVRRDDDTLEFLRAQRGLGGAALGSVEAWLMVRGMKTLDVRMRRASSSAQQLAEALEGRTEIHRVLYPGLRSHPGHAIALRQMRGGFSGMLSLRITGGEERAKRMLGRLELVTRATSLGATESLAEHRASVEGKASPVPTDLIRLSIGLEDPADLLGDLLQALE
jgi:cystathionine gamma-synthase